MMNRIRSQHIARSYITSDLSQACQYCSSVVKTIAQYKRAIKIVQLNFILAFPPAPKRQNTHSNDHAAMSSTCNPFTNGGSDVAKSIWAGSFFA